MTQVLQDRAITSIRDDDVVGESLGIDTSGARDEERVQPAPTMARATIAKAVDTMVAHPVDPRFGRGV